MEINVKTLTPLWTGGIEAGKCDRIHETGILGSLRWWMEVLVRGMGGQVSDPTSESRSGLDPKKFDVKAYRQLQDEVERRLYLRNAGLCDVSQIFGATGWKHRFRLEVEDTTSTIQLRDRYANNRFLTARKGEFKIKIQSLDPNFNSEVIGGLIQFIADWSALGARPQMGFGVIQIEGNRIDTRPLYDWLITTDGINIYSDPSLQNIFLAKIQPKNSNSLFQEQDTSGHKGLVLKKDKNTNGDDIDKDLHHFIRGTVEGDPRAAKIKIYRAYDNDRLMRVWGWVPSQAEVYKNGWDKEKVVKDIHQHLTAKYTLHSWREMKLERDCVTRNESNAQAFLRSLLGLEEGS